MCPTASLPHCKQRVHYLYPVVAVYTIYWCQLNEKCFLYSVCYDLFLFIYLVQEQGKIECCWWRQPVWYQPQSQWSHPWLCSRSAVTTCSPHTEHPTYLSRIGAGSSSNIPDLRISFWTQENIFFSDQWSSSLRCMNHWSLYHSGALQSVTRYLDTLAPK